MCVCRAYSLITLSLHHTTYDTQIKEITLQTMPLTLVRTSIYGELMMNQNWFWLQSNDAALLLDF